MRSGMIDMESNTTLVQCYPAHEAVPDGNGPFPGVVVVHDRFGLNPLARGIANRLAREGIYALSPNLYGLPTSVADVAPALLRPSGPSSYDYEDEEGADERASTLSDERAQIILHQAFGYARTRSAVRSGGIGVLGFATGGRYAFLASCEFPEDVRACVCFYPPGLADPTPGRGRRNALDRAESLRAPLLLFFGELDTAIRRREREEIRAKLQALGKDFSLEVFPDTGGDFFCQERDTYRIHTSKVAWEMTLDLFRRCL